MTDNDYKMMAAKVRSMRTEIKQSKSHLGYPPDHPNAAFLEGRIQGLTDVLMLICPNPMED